MNTGGTTAPCAGSVLIPARNEVENIPTLLAKVAAGIVSPADFVCLRVKWNDPEVSFFTMLADVPHGEAITAAEGRNPTFYVTESRDLPNDLFDLGGYELTVAAT